MKTLHRIATAFLALLALWAGPALAQPFPSRPISLILPFAAGTASDGTTRAILRTVERKTGATFVVLNRPGALGIVGTQAALQAPADGYTVLMTSISSHSVAGAFTRQLSYDPLNDFTHLAILTQVPTTIMVPAESRFKTIHDLVSHIKENPRKLSYSYASGSTWIAGAKFHKLLDLSATGVSYKSSQDALVDLLGGRVEYMVSDGVTAAAAAKGGKTRVLLILGDEKFSALGATPSMKEAGFPSMPFVSWTGLAVRVNVPAEAKQWLRRSFAEALRDSELTKLLLGMAAQLAPPDIVPEQFIGEQIKLWTDAAKEAGVTAQ